MVMRTHFYYFLWTLYCNPWSLVSLARCSCVAVLVCFIWLKWIGKLKRNCDLLTFPWRCREFRWRHTRCFRSLCCLDTVLCQGDRSWRWWCECWSRCHSWLIPHYLGRHTPLTLNKHCGLVNREEKRLAIPRLYPYQLDQQLLSRGKSALNMGPLFRDPIQSIKLWIPSNPIQGWIQLHVQLCGEQHSAGVSFQSQSVKAQANGRGIAPRAAYPAASAALCVTDRADVQPTPQPKPTLADWLQPFGHT